MKACQLIRPKITTKQLWVRAEGVRAPQTDLPVQQRSGRNTVEVGEEVVMSKLILHVVGTTAALALVTAGFSGTALADEDGGWHDTESGCTASNQQNGNLVPANVLGNLANGNNVLLLSNCS